MDRLVVVALAAAVACGPVGDVGRLPPLDPDATFAAHGVHGGFVIDRFDDGRRGRIEARGFGMFVVRADDAVVAALWLTAPAAVAARGSTAATAPVTARVEPSWPEQTIRLTLVSATDTLRAGPFLRTDGVPGMPALARTGQTNLDVRGTFRAQVTGSGGEPRGWFEVHVPSPDEPRVFAGALSHAPPEAGPALALALASELDWIEDHSIDVYRGHDRGRDGTGRGR